MQINAKTNVLGLIGYPIGHSFSPQVHNFMSEYLDLDYTYLPFEVEAGNVEDAINGMRALNIKGINVTAPYKHEVVPYLDEISDQAKVYGVVNTIKNVNGKLIGYNTDSDGLYMSILHRGGEIKDKDVLILGAGGSARSTCVKFAQVGAKSITVINRTQSKAQEIKEYVFKMCGYNTLYTEHVNDMYDVAVNTTSLGLYPKTEDCPMTDFSAMRNGSVAVDLIYNPSKTKFLSLAEDHGCKIINGLGMLINQAVLAYEIFTDTKTDVKKMSTLIEHEVFGL